MHCRREYAAAPWALIEGNDKYGARTKVLAKLVKILSCEMGYEPADPLPKAEAGKSRKRTSRS